MSIIVEATLSVLLDRLMDEVLSIAQALPKRKAEIAKEIKEWHSILDDLHSVLEDAEKKRSNNSKIESWLQDLEDIALDVEDVVEEFEYDNKQSQKRRSNAKVAKFFGSVFKSLTTPKTVVEFQELTKRLNDIVKRKKRLNLLKGNAAVTPIQRAIRPLDGPIPTMRKLYGREVEKGKIMNFLRQENNEIDILPIVGVGGIGKTTLVQHIYNDDAVICLFQVRAWACISQEWNLHSIFKTIIEDITGQPCDLQNLVLKVRDEVKNKKFCIVLDDLWRHDILQWKKLLAPLMNGAPGSKILVTTRNVDIADRVKTGDARIDMRFLSKDDCLDIYTSFVGFDIRTNSVLKQLGYEISQKCGGLPLAATIIGGLLRGNYNENDWRAILNNTSIVSQNGQYQIDSVLKMSYNDLSYDLKSCFLFCTIFPEDYRFIEHDIVELWIAAGLIKPSNSEQNIGHGYFVELVSRSLLISFGNYHVIHDLIRDMGRNVSNNKYCRWEKRVELSWKKLRHLSIHQSMICQVITDLQQREEKTFPLRTLMVVGGDHNDIKQIDDDDINVLFSKLPKLRVFLGRALPIQKLFICQMKCLKYFDLQECMELMMLPTEVGNLGNLQLLNLSRCKALTRLPTVIGNLVNLRDLNLEGCTGLTEMPVEIGNLVNLHNLYLARCKGLIKLPAVVGNLDNLKKLFLQGCTGLIELPTQIGNLGNLHVLNLEGCTRLTRLPEMVGNLSSLEKLYLKGCTSLTRLPTKIGNLGNLQQLNLEGCTSLTRLPTKIGNLGNLQQLNLEGCTQLTMLPVEIGNLGSLQWLYLSECIGLTELPVEVENLDSLQQLYLRECINLTELLVEIGNLGNVQQLDLWGCTSLIELPAEIGKLGNLQRLDLGGCTGLIELPIEVGKLCNLQGLYLWGCTSLMRLPAEVGNLGRLQQLYLWGCTGLTRLPIEVGNLGSLQGLYLGQCTSLTSLPVEVGNLGSLKGLYLWGCTGLTNLPAEVGNLSSLLRLDLGECTGLTELPIEVWNLGSLQRLDLEGCTGLTELPMEMRNLLSQI